MIKPESNNEVQSKLDLFEKIESILPSENWESTLDLKLKSNARSHNASLNLKIGLVVIILIINLGFIFNSVFLKDTQISKAQTDLHLISKELLINPTSIAN